MAKKTKQEAVEFDIINGNFDEHDGYDIEVSLQNKLRSHEQTHQQQSTQIGSKVSGIRVNNVAVSKDGNGVVDLTIPVVDQSLNEQSSNPVENGAVAVEINSLKSSKVYNMRTEDAGDNTNLTLVLENEQGDEIASCRIPKASEGGNQTYARVTANVSKNRIKQGDSVVLTWSYNHYNGDGTPTGTAAETIVIRVVNGTTETYRETLSNIADNTTRTKCLRQERCRCMCRQRLRTARATRRGRKATRPFPLSMSTSLLRLTLQVCLLCRAASLTSRLTFLSRSQHRGEQV